jgi:hypothetical protein
MESGLEILQVFNRWDIQGRHTNCCMCRVMQDSVDIDKIDKIYRLISYRYRLTRR